MGLSAFTADAGSPTTPRSEAQSPLLKTEQRTPFTARFDEEGTPLQLLISSPNAKADALRIRFVPQKDGREIIVVSEQKQESLWKEISRKSFSFWPKETNKLAIQMLEGSTPETWRGRSLPGLLVQNGKEIEAHFMGRGLFRLKTPHASSFQLHTRKGEMGFDIDATAVTSSPLLTPVSLSHLSPETSPLDPRVKEIKGIPFILPSKTTEPFSLKDAGWAEGKVDPSSFFENYDLGPAYDGDPRLPNAQVPRADYAGAWVLARYNGKPDTTNQITLRIGTRGEGSTLQKQYLQMDFAATIPKSKGPEEGYHLVYIPFTHAFAQDIEGDWLDIEPTKEIRLARRTPDPNRYRWRPLGLPSGVEIAGITLQKSPLQITIVPKATGALFVAPEEPVYSIRLTNISDQTQSFSLRYRTLETKEQTIEGELPPFADWEKEVALRDLNTGHTSVLFTLLSGDGKVELKRESMLALLPPDEMEYRSEGKLGTWDFGGNHFTSPDPDFVGSLMHKMGLRYGLFRTTPEVRAKYGVIKGDEAKVDMRGNLQRPASEIYAEKKAEHPDILPTLLLFHEDAISAEHSNRPPDLFSGRPPYSLNEKEKARFAAMWERAEGAAKSMRADFPKVKIALGNGGITLREEFYRAGFPAESFDSGGNESMTGANPPESQPPNSISSNSGLWMDRQLLDAYGYSDKPVTMCYEVIYPSTTPGNLSYETQANYMIRHLLLAMAWGQDIIRPGGITDKGNSYYHSNWGASGFFTARPRFEPKPAAVAVAVLNRVLDGAKYLETLNTGSDSLYLMHFEKKDGSMVYPYWIVKGTRLMTLNISGATTATTLDWEGKTQEHVIRNGQVTLKVTQSPTWLVLPKASKVKSIALGTPQYEKPKGKHHLLDPLQGLGEWKIDGKKDPLLEGYTPLTPRRQGKMTLTTDPGTKGLRISLKPLREAPATVPYYSALAHAKGLPLPEGAIALSLQVKGNSGWGRIIYELKDASGQVWTSIGARAEGGSDWLADAVGRESSDNYKPGEIADWNTDDVFGVSRICFDDWGWITIPLPGHYPGGHRWPANSQWRASGDGIVQPPLRLTRLIIEQSEKVLHGKEYRPPQSDEIQIRELTVIERDFDGLKSTPSTYSPEYQFNIE